MKALTAGQNKVVSELVEQLSEALALCEAYAGEQTESLVHILKASNEVCVKLGYGEPFIIDEVEEEEIIEE